MNYLKEYHRSLPLAFIVGRLLFYLSLPHLGLRGYSDLAHFFSLSSLGTPYFDYWSEFPPLFPFLSRLLFLLSGGREHVYDYLLVFLLTIVQAANLGLFLRLNGRISGPTLSTWRSQAYFLFLLVLSYGWWYFDPLAVFWMLLGLLWILEGKDQFAGAALGLGILTKLFPGLVLVVAWIARPKKHALQITMIALALVVVVNGGLYLASPEMTTASLLSQSGKGSWETVWALLDGNFHTGNFGGLAQRFDPSAAGQPVGNPPVLSPWIMLVPFGLLGAWLFWRSRSTGPAGQIAFLGLTWVVFLLWSPGWSPQWVLYLLPLVLLVLPQGEALLMALALILVNLLEWPVLLSRGYNSGLWLTIPLRALLLILLGYAFWKVIRKFSAATPEEEAWRTVEFQ